MLIPILVEPVKGKVVADIWTAFGMGKQHDVAVVPPLPGFDEAFPVTWICKSAIEFLAAVLVESYVL